MAKTQDRDFVFFSERDDGTWLAGSIDRPYFCLSASSFEEARDKAKRAFRFYYEHRTEPRVPISQRGERTNITLVRPRVARAESLEAA